LIIDHQRKEKVMAVKLRLKRMGRRHRPFFRINAVEARTPRDGKILEKLGHYDPIEKDPGKQVVLNRQRAEYWLSQGAVPSDTVSEILLRQGIKHKYAEVKAQRLAKARRMARAKGKFFNKAEKIAAEKEAEAKAKEAEEKAKSQAEAAKKNEQEAKVKAEAAKKDEEKIQAKTKRAKGKAKNDAQSTEGEPEAQAKEAEVELKGEGESASGEAEKE
jgi:small subunit ribosomal protein S16